MFFEAVALVWWGVVINNLLQGSVQGYHRVQPQLNQLLASLQQGWAHDVILLVHPEATIGIVFPEVVGQIVSFLLRGDLNIMVVVIFLIFLGVAERHAHIFVNVYYITKNYQATDPSKNSYFLIN